MSVKGIVKLNVGGTKYVVPRSHLEAHPESMLARLVSKNWHEDPSSEIFIDRDGERFKYVLDYLRDGKVPLPSSVSKSAVLNDLQYCCIDAPAESIEYDELEFSEIHKLLRIGSEELRMHVEKAEKKEAELRKKLLRQEQTKQVLILSKHIYSEIVASLVRDPESSFGKVKLLCPKNDQPDEDEKIYDAAVHLAAAFVKARHHTSNRKPTRLLSIFEDLLDMCGVAISEISHTRNLGDSLVCFEFSLISGSTIISKAF